MVGTLSPNEEAQLTQTIEMFEVITQSQPQDYQSLEILKEAYVKLGREQEALNTSKRIAQAYVLMGQLSSAILEYESILQRFPDDSDVQAALKEIESKANTSLNVDTTVTAVPQSKRHGFSAAVGARKIRDIVDTDIANGLLRDHARRFDVLLDKCRRNTEPGGDIVETADRGVLRQDVLRFDIDSHQRLHCSDVFRAAHALNAHVRGLRQCRVGVEFGFEISDERIHFLLLGLLRARRRHQTAAQLADRLLPDRRIVRRGIDVQVIQREPADLGLRAVAGRAIRNDRRLSLFR